MVPSNKRDADSTVSVQRGQQGRTEATPKCTVWGLIRDGTGSYFVTERASDPGIQRPGDPVDPAIMFYNKLQMSTYV